MAVQGKENFLATWPADAGRLCRRGPRFYPPAWVPAVRQRAVWRTRPKYGLTPGVGRCIISSITVLLW